MSVIGFYSSKSLTRSFIIYNVAFGAAIAAQIVLVGKVR